VNVTQLVKLSHSLNHLADIKTRVLLLQYARVVQQGAEIASRDVFHREIDKRRVLKGVEETNEPRSLGSRQNIAFHQNMPNLRRRVSQTSAHHPIKPTHLVHLEQRPLPHLLQRTHLARLLLPRKIHLPISPLSNLSDNMELVDAQLGPAPAQDDALAPAIRLELGRVLRRGEFARARIGVKGCASVFTR
jgi:hypothetical protein